MVLKIVVSYRSGFRHKVKIEQLKTITTYIINDFIKISPYYKGGWLILDSICDFPLNKKTRLFAFNPDAFGPRIDIEQDIEKYIFDDPQEALNFWEENKDFITENWVIKF